MLSNSNKKVCSYERIDSEDALLPYEEQLLGRSQHQQPGGLNEEYANFSVGEAKRMLKVNCLHRGDESMTTGKKYLICVDGTPASRRAFEMGVKLLEPIDHLYILHVRQPANPVDFGYLSWSESDDMHMEIRENLAIWNSSRALLASYYEDLQKLNPPFEYTLSFPVHDDPRKFICDFAKEHHISFVILGKHGSEDKYARRKNVYFRSYHKYIKNHVAPEGRKTLVF